MSCWLHDAVASLLANDCTAFLTHCGLVMPYDDLNWGQHWLSQWHHCLSPDSSTWEQFYVMSGQAFILYNEFENCTSRKLLPHLPAASESIHWGRVTRICINKFTIIGSDNDLSPSRRQAIIWTNARILLIRPFTNFSEILIEIHIILIQQNAFENVVCEMSAILSQPQCINSLRPSDAYMHLWSNHHWFR